MDDSVENRAEQLWLKEGETLIRLFHELEQNQQKFINLCVTNGKVIFSRNQNADEMGLSDILKKVLAIEYDESIFAGAKPGSTYTHYAVIVLPGSQKKLAEKVNSLKSEIANILSNTVDVRVKVNGNWTTANKYLMKKLGKPRANLKQIRRLLNIHDDDYSRISLSGTWQKPVYRKSYRDIKTIIKNLNYVTLQQDLETLNKYRHHKYFAYFYKNYYTSMDGNFKLQQPYKFTNRNGQEVYKTYLTKKVSSPIYIFTDKQIKDYDIEVRYKMKQVLGGEDIAEQPYDKSGESIISEKPIIANPPIYTYRKPEP